MNSDFRNILSQSIHEKDILVLCILTKGQENDVKKLELYSLLFDADKRVSDNAAWVFTHFDHLNNKWLFDEQDELIEEVMRTTSETKRRLILTMLLRQPFTPEHIRTDFLDFCLGNITSFHEPIGVKTLSMKLAFEQSQFFPELLSELKSTLEIMETEALSAGLKSIRKKLLKKM